MAVREPDAIALLKQDHREVEDLFEQYEKAKADGRKSKIAEQICSALIAHTMIEEEIFYPAVRGKIEEDTVDEAYVEHDGAKMLIQELMNGSPEDDFYDAKMTVLSEEIKHHVHEEEARSEGMFAQARQAGVDVAELGQQMRQRKQELLAQFKAGGLPQPKTTTFGQMSASAGGVAVPAE
ncbi:hemerythrin domain-containing protein [Sphingobium subterraneum]|uniref:Hemerythrin-like domain-containing protein n=1 Tax=Sphingobium subterraneum TaxID=627688 RepID=A0A841J7K4_9SPHN|nr:hemerythrin domain-containing protein [Sphingobium subterraneum]MBB6124538.1 hypothetical protein [Sphingobium subterraneum]